MNSRPKIAFVQDALPFQGGAEKVLEAALEAFPEAPIYTLIYRKEAFKGSPIAEREIHTSLIDKLPAAQAHHRAFLPLMPLAIEQFDLRGYDILLSFSYAVAHGIRPRPDQFHISYVYTPMRYAWQRHSQLMEEISSLPAPVRWALRFYLHSFRKWDFSAAARVDHFVTVSEWMAGCIQKAYHRPADVLYPPVDLQHFQPLPPRQEFYVTVSRLVAHKRIDVMVDAFNRLGLPLFIIGEGPELVRLQRTARPNVSLLGWQPQDRVAYFLGKAKGFIQANEEDFGIAMVEAQAAGCPLIALEGGAAKEIIRPGLTGQFFSEPTAESLEAAILQFEAASRPFEPALIRKNAERFDRSRFLQGLLNLVSEDWSRLQESRQKGFASFRESTLPATREQISREVEALEGGFRTRHF